MFTKLIAIACGGAAGSVLRYLVAGWGHRMSGGESMWGTFLVNVIGCAGIGVLATVCSGPLAVREEVRLAILVGLLGGFTTFSSYAWEAVTLADGGQWLRAAGYVLASNITGLAAAFGGVALARTMHWA